MTRHEQLVENYENALFELLMEGVIEREGEQIEKENEQLKNDPGFAIPPELDKRCMASIKKACRRRRSGQLGRKAYGVLSKVAVVVLVVLVLFTSAYAAFPNVRASTLNLLIEVSDIATELRFGDAGYTNNEVNGTETPSNSLPGDITTIAGYVIPSSITSNYQLTDKGTDQVGSWASFESTDDALITIDVQHGAGNTVNINTENSVTLETINVDQFQSVVSQQENEVIIAGIADTSNINFVFVTFEGVHFESAVNMIRDFLNENSEGKK